MSSPNKNDRGKIKENYLAPPPNIRKMSHERPDLGLMDIGHTTLGADLEINIAIKDYKSNTFMEQVLSLFVLDRI